MLIGNKFSSDEVVEVQDILNEAAGEDQMVDLPEVAG